MEWMHRGVCSPSLSSFSPGALSKAAAYVDPITRKCPQGTERQTWESSQVYNHKFVPFPNGVVSVSAARSWVQVRVQGVRSQAKGQCRIWYKEG